MTETRPKPRLRHWPDWVGLAARLVLGVVLLRAGVSRIADARGIADAAADHHIPLPAWSADVLGVALPIVGIVAGLLLVLGLLTRAAATTALLVTMVVMSATIWAWSQGPEAGYPQQLWVTLALAFAAGWLAMRPRSLFSLDAWLLSPRRPAEGDLGEDVFQADEAPMTATKE